MQLLNFFRRKQPSEEKPITFPIVIILEPSAKERERFNEMVTIEVPFGLALMLTHAVANQMYNMMKINDLREEDDELYEMNIKTLTDFLYYMKAVHDVESPMIHGPEGGEY